MRRDVSVTLAIVVSAWMGMMSHAAAQTPMPPQDDVEMLDPFEVSSVPITRAPREVVWPLPHVDGVNVETVNTNDIRSAGEVVQRPAPVLRSVLLDAQGHANGVRSAARYLSGERPLYPRIARENGWQGKVIVRAQVLEDGTAAAATLNRSCGYPILDEAAIDAVKRWRFAPAMDGNFSLASTVDVPVIFDLRAF